MPSLSRSTASMWLLLGAAGCGRLAGLGDYGPGLGGAGGSRPDGGGGGASTGPGGTGGTGQTTDVVAVGHFGGPGDDTVVGLGTDADGEIIVAGRHLDAITLARTHEVTSDAGLYVMKLDAQFEPVWSQSFPVTIDGDWDDLDVSAQGRIALIGQVDSPIDLGNGVLTPAGTGALLGRFDNAGASVDAQMFGTETMGLREGTAVAIGGEVTYLGVTYDVDPDLPADAGSAPPVVEGRRDSLVAALDGTDMVSWVAYLTGQGWQQVDAIATDAANRVIVLGTINATSSLAGQQVTATGADGSPDIAVAVLSPTGQLVATTVLGGAGRDDATDVTTIGERIVIGGHFQGKLQAGGRTLTATDGEDGYVISLDSDLAVEWTYPIGGDGSQRVTDLAGHSGGRVAAVGRFVNEIQLDRPHAAADDTAYALVLDEGGVPMWSEAWAGPQLDRADGVIFDGAEQIVVTGEFSQTIAFGGTELTSAGGRDLFMVRVDLSSL